MQNCRPLKGSHSITQAHNVCCSANDLFIKTVYWQVCSTKKGNKNLKAISPCAFNFHSQKTIKKKKTMLQGCLRANILQIRSQQRKKAGPLLFSQHLKCVKCMLHAQCVYNMHYIALCLAPAERNVAYVYNRIPLTTLCHHMG